MISSQWHQLLGLKEYLACPLFWKKMRLLLVASISTLMSPVPDPMHLSPLNKLEVGKPFDPVSILWN